MSGWCESSAQQTICECDLAKVIALELAVLRLWWFVLVTGWRREAVGHCGGDAL